MTMLKRFKPQTVNHFTMIAKSYQKDSETEDETSDHSEDPLSISESSSLSNWNNDAVEIPTIESSFRQMRVEMNDQPRNCLKNGRKRRRSTIQYTGELTLRLPMCDTPLIKRSCVSFKPSVTVRRITPAHKVPKEALWFQPEDYIRMERRCQLIAQKVLRGEGHCGRALCSRGLENLICSRRDQKVDGWTSVFSEQGKQQREGYFDEEKLKQRYQPSSVKSLGEAQIRGMSDETEVQRYLHA